MTDEGPAAGRPGDGDDDRETDADGGSETDEYAAATEGMTLGELRREIEEIDRDIVELIARRTYVADTVAQVKAERDLPTTDEQQEQQVMDRAGRNAERFDVDSNLVKAIFRLLIELNKIEQNYHKLDENTTQWDDE
jgi:chorismate mutase